MRTNFVKQSSAPWRMPENEIYDLLIDELIDMHVDALCTNIDVPLNNRQKIELTQLFKHAGHGRSLAYRFMEAVAKDIGVQDLNMCIQIAKLKDRTKAAGKIYSAERSSSDLARGRILLETSSQYRSFHHLMHSKNKRGHLPRLNMPKVVIQRDRHGQYMSDYLRNPRSSGYAGSINLDLGMDIGKGRSTNFELQIMPLRYAEAYDHSHALYDIVRYLDKVIDEVPKKKRVVVKKLKSCVVEANKAIFDEHAQRNDFAQFRSSSINAIEPGRAKELNDVLDRFGISAQRHTHHRNSDVRDWSNSFLNAVREAKSSILNSALSSIDFAANHFNDPA